MSVAEPGSGTCMLKSLKRSSGMVNHFKSHVEFNWCPTKMVLKSQISSKCEVYNGLQHIYSMSCILFSVGIRSAAAQARQE